MSRARRARLRAAAVAIPVERWATDRDSRASSAGELPRVGRRSHDRALHSRRSELATPRRHADGHRGLDCVGLVLAALEVVGRRVRVPPYRLRMSEIGSLVTGASDAGLVEASGPPRPGDVLLVRPGPAQHHLVIAASLGGFVHAHAGLRRVVLTPAPLPWTEERRWRLL